MATNNLKNTLIKKNTSYLYLIYSPIHDYMNFNEVNILVLIITIKSYNNNIRSIKIK